MWPRRLSHQPEPDLLVATDLPRKREAVPDAEELRQQVQAQSLRTRSLRTQQVRTQSAQAQLQQVHPTRLRPERRSLMPLRLCRQLLLHPRSRQRRPEQQRTQSRTELPVRSRHPKRLVPARRQSLQRQKQPSRWTEPSHRQVRGLPAATDRRLRRGADHDAAEPHGSPRRQIRTTQTAAPASQRALSPQEILGLLQPPSHQLNPLPDSNRRQRRPYQQLHPPRHQPRQRQHQFQRPHRSRLSRNPRRALRSQPPARRLRVHPRLPSYPPRRWHQWNPARRIRSGQPNLPARRTLPTQLRRPARAAHRWHLQVATDHRPQLWAGPSAANWNMWPYQDCFAFKVSIDCGTTLNRSPTTP